MMEVDMRVMILAASFAIPSSAPATPPAAAPAEAPAAMTAKATDECVRAGVQLAERPQVRIAPRRLDELPAGRLEHAVMRQFQGCVIPAVVREGIGR
jgi:hypothetical protein